MLRKIPESIISLCGLSQNLDWIYAPDQNKHVGANPHPRANQPVVVSIYQTLSVGASIARPKGLSQNQTGNQSSHLHQMTTANRTQPLSRPHINLAPLLSAHQYNLALFVPPKVVLSLMGSHLTKTYAPIQQETPLSAHPLQNFNNKQYKRPQNIQIV